MIPVREAEARLKDHAPNLWHAETRPLPESLGLVLAQPVTSIEPSPRFTNSAMDGVAVRFADLSPLRQGVPVDLLLVGESRAGVPFTGTLAAGQAVRISTGAALPDGADTVIPQEQLTIRDDRVTVIDPVAEGANVRRAGEEYPKGTILVEAMRVLTGRRLSLLASQGIREVPVFRPMRVSVFTTGTEVVPWDAEPGPAEIRNSNGIMLAAAVRESGARLVREDHLPDDPEATVAALESAAGDSDVILVSGGILVGPHDHVRAASARVGFREVFWKVAQKPGKPLFVADRTDGLLVGLPGNPAASYMCFAHYVRPFLKAAMGYPWQRETVEGTLVADIRADRKRTLMKRVRLQAGDGGWQVQPVERQGSNMITSFAEADGYILVTAEQPIAAGTRVTVYRFPEV